MFNNFIRNQFVKFLIVGFVNAIFGYGIFSFFILVGMHYSLAALFGTILGVLFNFRTISAVVFNSRNNWLIIKFAGVYVIIYLLNLIGLYIFKLFFINVYIAGAILILPMAIISYMLNKKFVFNVDEEISVFGLWLKKTIVNLSNYHSYFIWFLYSLCAAVLIVEIGAFNISPLNFHHIYGEGLAGGGRDFSTFYFAGYRLRTVNEFYVVKNYNEFLPEEHERGISRFIYPPLLAFIFVPLSFLSLHVAFTWYSYLILIIFGASIFLATHFIVDKILARLVIGAIFLLSPIIWMHLAHGQTDILVLFCLALAFYFLSKYNSKSAGFFIGIAALLKLTPVIFIPYLYLKNKKAFWISVLTLIFGSLLLGVDRLFKFVDNLSSFSGTWATSSIFNNGLMGIFYNRLTRSIMSFSTSRSVYSILILLSVIFFFLALYRRIKINKTSTDEFFVLAEFAIFTSLMILIPSVSLIYNGVHLLFLLLTWWWLRERKIFSLKKQFFLDMLIFLIFSQPLLISWFQTIPGSLFFVFRPIYILIFLFIIFKEYSKKTYEQRS